MSGAGLGGLLDKDLTGDITQRWNKDNQKNGIHDKTSEEEFIRRLKDSHQNDDAHKKDMEMVMNNHKNSGDAGMGRKDDWALNMGHPLEPMDHYPVKGPEDRNKELDKRIEEEKKKNEEGKKKKEEEDKKNKEKDEKEAKEKVEKEKKEKEEMSSKMHSIEISTSHSYEVSHKIEIERIHHEEEEK